MSVDLKFQAHIARSVEAVGTTVTDLQALPKWLSFQEVSNVSPGPLQVGTTFQAVADFLGKPRPVNFIVTEYQPGKKFVYESIDPTRTRFAFSFQPVPVGTGLTFEFLLGANGGTSGPVKDRLREQLREDLTHLVELLETELVC